MKIKTFLLFFVIVLTAFFVACGPASQNSSSTAAAPQEHSFSDGIDIIEEERENGGDEDGGNSRRTITARVSDTLMQAAEGTIWTISIPFSEADLGTEPGGTDSGTGTVAEGKIRFRSRTSNGADAPQSQKEAVFSLSLAPIEQTLHFPRGAIGFVPREISIEISEPARIEGLTFEAEAYNHEGRLEDVVPISADLGIILAYRREHWRVEEWELFRWNLIPNVLIFDFADYAIQRRYFARLAFFVGVTGESGGIQEHSYYEGRHVFNAHDYRPEDLAAFFRQAEEQGINLNKEERLVRDIALNQGVLRKKNGVISAGKGAILSTSQEIPHYLERRLLAHEAMHGIFYAVPDFREGAFSLYKDMSEIEKEFWYHFLANKGRLDNRSGYDGYDVENEYLLVNEIVGHMMQLRPHVVEPYFLDVYLSRMEEQIPEKRSLFQSIRRDKPEMFAHTRADMEALLEKTLGLKRGSLFMTEKAGEGS